MSDHILYVRSVDEENDEYEYTIGCPTGTCGYIECDEVHEVDGVSAADGPHDCDLTNPWCDEETFTFHGVEHEWHWGMNWTVPYDGCAVRAHFDLGDWIDEVQPVRVGIWVIDEEWDDETMIVNGFTEVPA